MAEPQHPDGPNFSVAPEGGQGALAASGTMLYLALTVLTAAAGLAVEIIAGRMIAPYLGMSLYTWTAIIAVVLAGFSIGHWIGGRIAGWPPARAERTVAWALVGAAATTLASLILIRLVAAPVIAMGFGAVATILAITMLLFFAPSLFVGIPSPVLTKRAIDNRPHAVGQTLGHFYAAGAFGSIVGTLTAGYVLISWLGTISSLIAIALLYLAMAAAMFWNAASIDNANREGGARTLTSAAISVALIGVIVLAAHGTDAFQSNCKRESQYYCIRVDDISKDLGAEARVLVLDHLAHGINVREQPGALVSPYVAMQNALVDTHLSNPGRMRAFFVGGGAYTLPRAWASRHAGAHITVSELDPAVTDIARTELWLGSPVNLTVRHEDARSTLLRDSPHSYDVIIGDAFHDIAVPPHLVTGEFFLLVASRLANGGLYVMNVVDDLKRPRLMLSVAETLAPHFEVLEIWSERASGDAPRRATFVLAGLARPSPASSLTLGDGTEWRRWSAAEAKRLAAKYKAVALSDDFSPVDRLIGAE